MHGCACRSWPHSGSNPKASNVCYAHTILNSILLLLLQEFDNSGARHHGAGGGSKARAPPHAHPLQGLPPHISAPGKDILLEGGWGATCTC